MITITHDVLDGDLEGRLAGADIPRELLAER